VSTLVPHHTRAPLRVPLTGTRTLAGAGSGLLLGSESLGWLAVETGGLCVGESGGLGWVPTPAAVVPRSTSDMAPPRAPGSCVDSPGG